MKIKCTCNIIILTITFITQILYLQNSYSQNNTAGSYERNGFLLPDNSLYGAAGNSNKLQIFKSAGVKIGYTINEYGWHHPFPLITQNYYDAAISTGAIGVYAEGLSSKYFSSVFDIAYHGRTIKFDYNLYDGNGNVIGTNTTNYGYNITSLCITEKVKYTMLPGGFETVIYGFGGFKFDFLNASDFDPQLESYMNTYSSDASGFIAGIGFSYGKKFRFSAELYYSEDFTNTFETEYGNYKNNEFGFNIGFGYNIMQ